MRPPSNPLKLSHDSCGRLDRQHIGIEIGSKEVPKSARVRDVEVSASLFDTMVKDGRMPQPNARVPVETR